MLTEREVTGMKMILQVSMDSEVKKLLTKKLYEHYVEVELRDIRRQVMILRRRIIGK